MQSCDLNSLRKGGPGLTSAYGEYMAEAAAVCLESHDHASGVSLGVTGAFNCTPPLIWESPTNQERRCHADQQSATEHGACGIAILLIEHLTGKVVVERSRKGTGFDYWLGDVDDLMFQGKARLEVSGVLKGSQDVIDTRLKQKIEQTKISDGLIPAYVVIISFQQPVASFVVRG